MEQFTQVFQKLAHKIALNAVTKLDTHMRIVTSHYDDRYHGSEVLEKGKVQFIEVSTDKVSIFFRGLGITYTESPGRDYRDHWDFTVEEKLYNTSNDWTKISYVPYEGKEKQFKEKITKFIETIMAENKITPVPRFSLRKYTERTQKQLVFATPAKQVKK